MHPKRTILPGTHEELELVRAWFWARVRRSPTTDCWEWTADIEGMGYGAATLGHTTYKAHRLAWELSRGPIPDGLRVLHRCDVRRCVRPNHLFLGTLSDNMRDMWRKGRQGRVGRRGEASPFHKLTTAQVLEIRALAADGMSQETIGQHYGVTQTNVGQIVRRQTWAHV